MCLAQCHVKLISHMADFSDPSVHIQGFGCINSTRDGRSLYS